MSLTASSYKVPRKPRLKLSGTGETCRGEGKGGQEWIYSWLCWILMKWVGYASLHRNIPRENVSIFEEVLW